MCHANRTMKSDHDCRHVGQCPECGADVDAEGDCVEIDDCYYSPEVCEKCGHRPCDGSC